MKPHDIRFEGGNGGSMASAIVVRGAESELEGTYAAYAWLVNKYGKKDVGWKLVSHSHEMFNRREIATFKIEFPDGTQRVVFFDCTESFGKF
jgi:hypothetical protein